MQHTPERVAIGAVQLSGRKDCPLRDCRGDRKRLAGGAGMHCLPAVSFSLFI